jgi:pyruvate/2-oxoglutarate dehydrogenase complex dihydrolipoamide dehydrogenase (E3) component
MRFVILGGGPAGYAAATAADALGADVTLIEDHGLGGSCTLTDAIPSKTLLSTTTTLASVERAESAGISFDHAQPHVDLLRTVAHARWVATHQSRGIRDRLEQSHVSVLHGRGRITGPGTIEVVSDGFTREVPFDRLLISTGASPWEPPFAQIEHHRVFTTREALEQREIPEHLIVVGAGATGCEYAEFFSSCGSRVTLLSARGQVLPAEDEDVAEIIEEAFLSRGIEIQMNARIEEIDAEQDRVRVRAADGREFTGSHAIVCMGMRANTSDLGLETLGIELDDRGSIRVDEHMRTNVDGIYAAGDVAGGMMLASTAAMQGRHVALHAFNEAGEPLRLKNVAWTIFTRPEVATVGLTESEAERHGIPVEILKHYMGRNPRGVIQGWKEGLIKLIMEPETGVLLGGSIVGYRASENIATLALCVNEGLTVEALAQTGTVTPSMSESLQRAAERAINRRLRETGGGVAVPQTQPLGA